MSQSNAVTPFVAPDGAMLRVVVLDGEPWFSAADACAQLGLENVGQALSRLDDDENRLVSATLISSDSQTVGRGGARKVSLVSESGLYTLILTGRTAAARIFKRWVTHDVLPAIRRTGQYGALPQISYAESLRQLAAEVERREALERQNAAQALELESARPRAAYVDAWVDPEGAVLLRDVVPTLRELLPEQAKSLGEHRLRNHLISKGILYRKQHCSRTEYHPYAKPATRGWFRMLDQPEAPLCDGRMRQTLGVTNVGKTRLAEWLAKNPIGA